MRMNEKSKITVTNFHVTLNINFVRFTGAFNAKPCEPPSTESKAISRCNLQWAMYSTSLEDHGDVTGRWALVDTPNSHLFFIRKTENGAKESASVNVRRDGMMEEK